MQDEKKKKVDQGLSVCHGQYLHHYCSQCPYPMDIPTCVYNLHRDARDLLKAQEPRLMSIEEAAEADHCYVEYRSGDIVPVLVQRFDTGNFKIQKKDAYHIIGLDFIEKYGRFWTSLPTDAQREATPWEQ